jgi:hypothetical protein
MLQYRNMVVQLIDRRSVAFIDVHLYRNATGLWDKVHPTGNHACTDGYYDVRPSIVSEMNRKALPLGADLYQLQIADGQYEMPRPRYGPPRGIVDPFSSDVEYVDLQEMNRTFEAKGSPDDIADTLRLACGLGVVQKHMHWTGGPVTAGLLNAFCDRYLGIDCNGFVGNYLQSIGLSYPGPNNSVERFAPPERRKSRLEDVRPLDVLVWLRPNGVGDHVAIIDQINRVDRDHAGKVKAVECTVVESCGGSRDRSNSERIRNTDGLDHSIYILTPGSPQRFKVMRSYGWQKNREQYDRPSGEQVAIAHWV